MKHHLIFSAFIFALFCSAPLKAQFTLDLESGIAFQSYNKLSIPNQEGTQFDFTKDFSTKGPIIPFRARFAYSFRSKNHFILLYAPLNVKYTGEAPYEIQFRNSSFGQNSEIDGKYKNNSYRLTYRRDFVFNRFWILGAGLTAEITDARVSLMNDEGLRNWKNEIGFMPLIHVFAEYKIEKYSIYFEGDGLFGGQDQVLDMFLGGRLRLSKFFSAKMGYRLLQRQVKEDDIYNSTLLNYAAVGLILQI